MSEVAAVFADLEALASLDSGERSIAAAQVGDVLRSGVLDAESAQLAIARLVAAFTNESAQDVREEVLHTIMEAADRYKISLSTATQLVDTVAPTETELLTYALAILGATRDSRAVARVEPYVHHSHAGVAAAASEALTELG